MSKGHENMNNNQSKERIRRRYKDAHSEGVEVIPAKEKSDPFDETSEMNVVVYVRVSTDNAQQTSSYEMQQKYYSDFVKRHPSWKLIRIYADEGISGTSLKKRDEFKRMIEDCKKGGINLIVTKNVSRWSRNILDGIGIVRELEALNPPVGVFFENEGLYSLNPENATLLQINSTMAEHESRTKSTSMISSLMMRFSHGLFLTPPLLGYDNNEDGGLVINREEAATVRLIFLCICMAAALKKSLILL
jgi:DNA invertase Pin-like site-specific DNA recombinase